MLTLLMTTITNNSDQLTLLIGKITAVFEVAFVAVKLLKVVLRSILAGVENTDGRFARFINGIYKALTYFERNSDKTIKEINERNAHRLKYGCKSETAAPIEDNAAETDEDAEEG